MLTRVIFDMPESVYHANCGVDVPLFSSSIAKILLSDSELHAYHAHPMLGGGTAQRTKALDDGTALDSLLAGNVDAVAVTDEFDDFRSKAAKEWRDAQLAAARVPMTRAKYDPIVKAARHVRDSAKAAGCDVDAALKQVTVVYGVQASNGNVVWCKSRFDFLAPGFVIVDLKKIARGANPKRLARHVYDYAYDVQAALYTIAAEHVVPDSGGRWEFRWLFAEIEAPYAVSLSHPAGTFRTLGNVRLQRAIDRWEAALRTDTWPAYGTGVHAVHADMWMLTNNEIDEVSE